MGLLAAQRDVIAVDLPGFGDSPELPDGIAASAANLGAAVSELCAGLGIERPHLAGNSLGAWAALEIAKAGARGVGLRDLAGRFVARAAGPATPRPAPLGAATAARALWGARLGASPRGVPRGTVAQPELLSPREARGLVADWLDAPGYDAANAQMRSHVSSRPTGRPCRRRSPGARGPARRAAEARADAARQPLSGPRRARPHTDLGRSGAGRGAAARVELRGGRAVRRGDRPA